MQISTIPKKSPEKIWNGGMKYSVTADSNYVKLNTCIKNQY